MIAHCVLEQCTEPTVVATKGEVVNNRGICSTGLRPCNQGEADTIVLLHTQDAVRSGFKKIMIAANDTDGVVWG